MDFDGKYDGQTTLFMETLWSAVAMEIQYNDGGLLAALRKKWPDAVKKYYAEVKKKVDDEYRD